MAEFFGQLSLDAAIRDHGRTVLAAQSFRAPYHISKPYWDADARALLVQVVNPTAGILAGDRLESKISVHADASLLVTTPSASRVFRMGSGSAECRQHFSVAAGGWLEVAPEPLVPHQGSRYQQITTVDVGEGGTLLFVDQLMPGRVGHSEAWSWDGLCLDLTVRVAGELVFRERFEHSGPDLRAMAELGRSGPGACFGNAILISTSCTSTSVTPWREPLDRLHRNGLWLGVSALRKGGWSIKLIARDAVQLRQGLRDMREALLPYFPRLACNPRKL